MTYSAYYSEPSFWNKVRRFSVRSGKELVEKSLMLYWCLQDPDTPARAKSVIAAVLGYFILPADALPDPTPVVGLMDDLGAIAAAFAVVAIHIKPEHQKSARDTAARWFGAE